jgi:hypothetical protein
MPRNPEDRGGATPAFLFTTRYKANINLKTNSDSSLYPIFFKFSQAIGGEVAVS